MTVTIGSLTFDHASYDSRGDVLYLRVADRLPAATSEETPEGHVLRYDAEGKVIGLTAGAWRFPHSCLGRSLHVCRTDGREFWPVAHLEFRYPLG